MAKPAITKRAVKAAALTYAELDTNFQNLADATVSITGGSTAVTADLNGNITLVAGTNVTITGNNTAKTITINSTASGGAANLDALTDVTITGTPSIGHILRYTANNVFENVVAGYLNGVIGDTNPTLGGNLDTNDKTISNSLGRVRINDQLTIGSSDSAGINIGYESGGSWRIESNAALLICAQMTFNGSANGPNIGLANGPNGGSINIGTAADPDDKIYLQDVVNINSLTTTQRNALVNPQNGDLFYNTSTHKFQGYANGTWVDLH
jgi:hypothetical protein